MTPVNPFEQDLRAAQENPFVTDLQAEAQGGSGEDVGFLGTVADVGTSVVDGVRDGLQETIDLTKEASDYLDRNLGTIVIGGDNGFFDYRSPEEMQRAAVEGVQLPDIQQESATVAGSVTHGITQFLTGWAAGGRMLRGVKTATKGATVAKAFAQGAIADFIAFDEHEKRLSNLANEYGFGNALTDFLAADDNDEWYEGRFKNVLEGGVLGVATEGATHLVKGMMKYAKAFRQASKMKDKEAAAKMMDEVTTEIEKEIDLADDTFVPRDAMVRHEQMDLFPEIGPGVKQADELTDETYKGLPQRALLKEKDFADVIKELGADQAMFDNLGAASGKGGINPETWANAESAQRVAEALATRLRDRAYDAFADTQSFKAIENIAAQYALTPKQLMENMRQLGVSTRDMPAQLVATDMVLKRVLQQVSDIGLKHGTDFDALPPEAQKQVLGLLQASEDLMVNRGLVQKHAARTTASGNIVEKATQGDYSVDMVTGALQSIKEGEDLTQVMKQITRHRHKPNRLVRALHSNRFGKGVDKVNEFWINALLSHPKTHIINMLSGSVETVIKPLEESIADAVRGDFKGAAGQLVGAYQGFRNSMRGSAAMMKDVADAVNAGMPLDEDALSEIAKTSPLYQAVQSMWKENNILDPFHRQYDVPDHAINGVHGKAIRTPSRFLAAEDEFMKQVNFRNKVYMDEYARGYRKGLSHGEIAENIAERLEKAVAKEDVLDSAGNVIVAKGEGLDEGALQYAREVTFTQDLEYGIGKWIQEGVVKHPLLRQVMPFVRVPTNLIRHMMQRFPVLGAFQRDMRKALLYGTPKQRAQAAAKQIVGITTATYALSLAMEGKITGGGPLDPDERRDWLNDGNLPYSFVNPVTGEVTQFHRLDPRFGIFGLAADLWSNRETIPEGEYEELAWALAASAARNMTSKTYFTGISNVITALDSGDPKKIERILQQHVGSYVPNVVGAFNDDTELKQIHSFVDALLQKVPGLSDRVDPKRNVLGETMHRYGMLGPDMLSPIAVSKKSDDPLDNALWEMRHGFTLPPKKIAGTTIDMTDYRNDQGQTAWDRWQELTGSVKLGGYNLRERLTELLPVIEQFPNLADPNVKHLPSKRVAFVNEQVRVYRQQAKRLMFEEFPELKAELDRQERQSKLAPVVGIDEANAILDQ